MREEVIEDLGEYPKSMVVALSRRSDENAIADFVAWRWPDHEPTRSFLLATWKSFNHEGLAKGNFVSDLISENESKLFQRLWEMVLALHLIEQGFEIQSHEFGPDFSFEIDGKKVWVEATAPEPCDAIRERLSRQGGPVLYEQILLRWTSALASKNRKFLGYRKEGIVKNNDVCIIAINGHLLGEGRGISRLPYAVEAVFPIGPLAVGITNKPWNTVIYIILNVGLYENRAEPMCRQTPFSIRKIGISALSWGVLIVGPLCPNIMKCRSFTIRLQITDFPINDLGPSLNTYMNLVRMRIP